MRTDLQEELRAKERRMEKPNNMSNITPREEFAEVGPQKDIVHLEIRAHSSLTQAKEAKERDELVHLRQQAHRTAFSKGDGKGGAVLTEVQTEAHQNLLVKIRQGKRTDHLTQISTEEVVTKEIPVVLGMSECAKFKTPTGCRYGGKCVHQHTGKSDDEENFMNFCNSFTFRRMMSARCNYEKMDDKTHFRVKLHHLGNRYILKRRNWDQHLESSRQHLKISELQTLQHSEKDPLNVPCAWKT